MTSVTVKFIGVMGMAGGARSRRRVVAIEEAAVKEDFVKEIVVEDVVVEEVDVGEVDVDGGPTP